MSDLFFPASLRPVVSKGTRTLEALIYGGILLAAACHVKGGIRILNQFLSTSHW